MNDSQQVLLKAIEQTLRFENYGGGIAAIVSHDTGWRTLPGLTVARFQRARGLLQVEGRKDIPIRPGGAVYIPPGVHHRFKMNFSGRGISQWSVVNFYVLGSVNIFHFLNIPSLLPRAAGEKVGEINVELDQLRRSPPISLKHVFKERAVASRLLSVLTESAVFTDYRLEFLQAAGRLAPVLHFIQEHLAEDIRGPNLAKLVHLSTSRFGAIFKAVLGKAPGEYIQSHRIEMARQLLALTDLGVHEIGRKVGFGDPFHFSRIFKQYCRVSPKLYRQNIRRGLTTS